MYLIDTNVCILAIAGHEPDAGFLKRAIEKNTISLSVITVAEYLTQASPNERQKFQKLTINFPVLIIDYAVARLAARYRKQSLKKTRVSLLDCFLAAQARENNLTLVTNNLGDFPMTDIKIIKPA